jgi:hypothetical protein
MVLLAQDRLYVLLIRSLTHREEEGKHRKYLTDSKEKMSKGFKYITFVTYIRD